MDNVVNFSIAATENLSNEGRISKLALNTFMAIGTSLLAMIALAGQNVGQAAIHSSQGLVAAAHPRVAPPSPTAELYQMATPKRQSPKASNPKLTPGS
jgi:hypothetical protein